MLEEKQDYGITPRQIEPYKWLIEQVHQPVVKESHSILQNIDVVIMNT